MPEPDAKVSRGRKKKCMPSGMCCIRTTLISFNLITGLVGVCIFATGIMLFLSSSKDDLSGIKFLDELIAQEELPNTNFRYFSLLCMIVGTLITFVSFVGSFGACIGSRCLLITYMLSVVVAVLLQLLVSTYAIVNSERVNNSMKDMFYKLLQKKDSMTNETLQTLDAFQNNFDCCGVDSFSDWFREEKGERVVPDSCCLEYSPGCGALMDPPSWKKIGCFAKTQIFILHHLPILALLIIGIVFLQLYGIISSILLYFHIRAPKRTHPFQSYRYERANM